MAKVSEGYLRQQATVLQRYHGNRSRTRIAADLGVSLDQYKRYLLGTTMLRPDLMWRLADLYGIPSKQLARDLGIISSQGETVVPADPPIAESAAPITLDDGPSIRELGIAAGLTDARIQEIERAVGSTPTTLPARQVMVSLAAEVDRVGAHQGQNQRRA